MLKILRDKKAREDPKTEPEPGQDKPAPKKTAAEIRLRKDLQELDLPSHAEVNFPEPE